MKLFDENGNEYDGDFVYDASGEKLNKGWFEDRKEDISDAFSTSFLLGLILLFISPAWAIIYFLFIGFFKLFKYLLRIIWWVIRLPFSLIIYRRLPLSSTKKDNYI